MTGLRGRGYNIERQARKGKDSVYHITEALETGRDDEGC